MTTLLMLAAGAMTGGGLWIIVLGLHGRRPWSDRRTVTSLPTRRLAWGAAAAVVTAILTRWPVAAGAAAAAVVLGPAVAAGRSHRTRHAEIAEAVATWSEMLRDSLSAARGLEEAVVSTALLAPAPIRPALTTLRNRLLDGERLAGALPAVASALDDPTADLVVTALGMAAAGEAQDLAGLLGSLAQAARDQAAAALRIDASRARVRTSVRGVLAFTGGLAVILVALNRSYFTPFGTTGGQLAMAVVITCFAGGVRWITVLGRPQQPERFLAEATT